MMCMSLTAPVPGVRVQGQIKQYLHILREGTGPEVKEFFGDRDKFEQVGTPAVPPTPCRRLIVTLPCLNFAATRLQCKTNVSDVHHDVKSHALAQPPITTACVTGLHPWMITGRQVHIHCALAAYHTAAGRAERDRSARAKHFERARALLSAARQVAHDEQLVLLGLGQLSLAEARPFIWTGAVHARGSCRPFEPLTESTRRAAVAMCPGLLPAVEACLEHVTHSTNAAGL